jgi:hypothetical protein
VERQSDRESKFKPLMDKACKVRIRLVVETSGELLDSREFQLAMMVEPEFRIAFGEKKPATLDSADAET